MRWRILGWNVLGAMAVCACSTTPSAPRTEMAQPIRMPLPSECARSCPPLPLLTSHSEGAAVSWVHEVVYVAGECRRLHDACREAQR